jgi:hypothetical protein
VLRGRGNWQCFLVAVAVESELLPPGARHAACLLAPEHKGAKTQTALRRHPLTNNIVDKSLAVLN